MAYVPPTGWVEEIHVNDGLALGAARIVIRFHASQQCPRIHDAGALRRVDKPYSALRCTLCASEHQTATAGSAADDRQSA